MNDDKRLLERDDTSASLRSLLQAAKQDEPSKSELAGLHARLADALPKGALAGGASSVATAAIAKWLVLGLGALAAVAVGGYALSGAPKQIPVPPDVSSGGILATAVANPAADSATSLASTAMAMPAPSASMPMPTITVPTAKASAPAAPAETEEAMLARAHAELLRGDASQALETATAHARAYPRGNFSQEREMIAIEALLKRGDRAAASARAVRFRKSFPGSGHLARLDSLLPAP